MQWVTRERPNVDRVACPWLIRRFVDADARLLYVPADQVMAVAKREDAVPYDVPDVELGHHGARCSFDAGRPLRLVPGSGGGHLHRVLRRATGTGPSPGARTR